MRPSNASDTLDGGRLTVNHEFTSLLHRCGLDTFESYYSESVGELLRDVGPRENVRLTLDAGDGPVTFFLKRHGPVGLGERLRAYLSLRRPRTPARVEWENIRRLEQLGVASMKPVVLGEDPVSGRSFLMTARIESGLPADDYAREHLARQPAARRCFVRRLGELVRNVHAAGLTHRDLYLCHVFVRPSDAGPQLHLIDLQRLGRRVFRRRWAVKDVAQLAYSRPEGVFSNTDAIRFLHAYFGVGRLGPRHKRFLRSVLGKVRRMERRKAGRERV